MQTSVILEFASVASEWQMKVSHKFKFNIWFIQQDNLFIHLYIIDFFGNF